MPSNTLKSITIDQVRVGVYVAKLDISWLDSPFVGNTRLIKKEADIIRLRSAGAKSVVIDTSRGLDVDSECKGARLTGEQLGVAVEQLGGELGHHLNGTQKEISLSQEIGAASQLREKIKKTMDGMRDAIINNKTIDTETLQPLVENTIQSLSRNNQALLSLVHISRKTKKLEDHVFGSFCLSLNLALAMGISESEREQLGLAALFHEAGWMSLPLNLLGKRTPYSVGERALVSKHPELALKALLNSNLPELSQRIIVEHHELLDGSGFPRKLSGDLIHPLTQLFSIVDSYDEKVHQLADHPGMSATNALKFLYYEASLGRYCPEIVAKFIALLGVYPPTTPVLLNTGEKGVVREVCSERPLLPVVSIYYDRCGLAYAAPMIIDLSRQKKTCTQRTITDVIDLSALNCDPAKRLSVVAGDIA